MALSPMMQQYMQIKDVYKDTLVFYRLGDFYEMFFEDAKLVSKELELTLHPNKVFLQQAHKGSAFLGIFVKPHRRYLLQKIKSRISNRMERMNRCLSAKKVNRDKLLYISCVANSYMGYMRHMACHRFKNLLVERNTSFHRIGNFKGEKLIFVPFIKGIVPLMK